MIPGLPAPHHFFNVMSIAGTTGVSLFDPPVAVSTAPRDTATVISGTAATPEAFSTFSISKDCDFAADGSSIRFGDELSITGPYPNLHLERIELVDWR